MTVQNLNKQQPQKNTAVECGNCWGHQEWQGEISEKQEKRTDKSLDGFILKFVKKYL